MQPPSPGRGPAGPRSRRPSASPDELPYRLNWLATGIHPGSHRSRIVGAGETFFGTAPLVQGRDARRLDLRASASDPWSRTWVREFRQRSRVPVMLVVDLSRSIDFVGHADRRDLAARFGRALGRAAFRRGDPFGFIAADARLDRAAILPPTLSLHTGERVAERLARPGLADGGDRSSDRSSDRSGDRSSSEGLLEVVRWLPQQPSLVFVLTDGHLEPGFVDRLLRSLSRHDVVFVLLEDSAEHRPPARWGLVRLADLETGRERLVFLRPGLAERMAAERQAHRQALGRVARRHNASMLSVEDELDLQAVARHFLGRGQS